MLLATITNSTSRYSNLRLHRIVLFDASGTFFTTTVVVDDSLAKDCFCRPLKRSIDSLLLAHSLKTFLFQIKVTRTKVGMCYLLAYSHVITHSKGNREIAVDEMGRMVMLDAMRSQPCHYGGCLLETHPAIFAKGEPPEIDLRARHAIWLYQVLSLPLYSYR